MPAQGGHDGTGGDDWAGGKDGTGECDGLDRVCNIYSKLTILELSVP